MKHHLRLVPLLKPYISTYRQYFSMIKWKTAGSRVDTKKHDEVQLLKPQGFYHPWYNNILRICGVSDKAHRIFSSSKSYR
jgi:hypothetical protein